MYRRLNDKMYVRSQAGAYFGLCRTKARLGFSFSTSLLVHRNITSSKKFSSTHCGSKVSFLRALHNVPGNGSTPGPLNPDSSFRPLLNLPNGWVKNDC